MAVTARVNPQKRNILIQRLSRAPWWVLIAALLITLFFISVAEDPVYQRMIVVVGEGVWTTIWVTVVGYTLAVIMGLILALLKRSKNVVVYQLTTLYIEVVRGVPTLVLVYYFALAIVPELVNLANALGESMVASGTLPGLGEYLAGFQTRWVSNAARAIAGLAISYSAFLSEIFRAGIESIERGQRDAAASLGMTRWQTMRHVVLPQALRNVLPPLGNDFIAMLKESSLVSVVGVEDITRQGATLAQATFTFFPGYTTIAITYLILTLSLSLGVKIMESWLNRGRQHVLIA
ncbi:MAG: amino acid ABC transporter permease [Blastochloris sp.]|nr:amino acid ABC transporter permease [Blastochloris sp.]